VIILSVILIGFFAYSAWVDRPSRVRDFAEVEIPDNMPDLSVSKEVEQQSLNIVVRILNGNGVSGVAYKLREYLLTQGFDVSETTNADHFNYEKTIVYLHTNDYSMSKKVSDKLKIDNNPVLDDRAPDYPCDITIVMGKDYKQLPPFLENN
jgi:LytR cell envelope-related transcriptional attenuator